MLNPIIGELRKPPKTIFLKSRRKLLAVICYFFVAETSLGTHCRLAQVYNLNIMHIIHAHTISSWEEYEVTMQIWREGVTIAVEGPKDPEGRHLC
jgi:hypothetical protein